MHLNSDFAYENAQGNWILGGPYEAGTARRWLAYPALRPEGCADGVVFPGRAMLVIELTDRRLVVLKLCCQRSCETLDPGLIDRLAACALVRVDRNHAGRVEVWRRKGMTHVQFRGVDEFLGQENEVPRELAWSFALQSDSDPLQALFTRPDRLHEWIATGAERPLPPAVGDVFRHNAAWRALQKEKTGGAPIVGARERFIAGLDRWSLHYCVRQKLVCGRTYNFLQGEGSSIKQQRRRRAVEQLPILAAAASDPSAGRGGLLDAIDSGASGSKALAVAYRIPLWVTSRLEGVCPQWLNLPVAERETWNRDFHYLLRLLAEIGPEQWPKTAGDWKIFREFFDVFLGTLHCGEIHEMKEFDHRLAGALLRELGSLGWGPAECRVERQYDSMFLFGICMEFFRHLVYLFRSAEGSHVLAVVCGGRSAREARPGKEQVIAEILRIAPARLLGAARRWRQAALSEAFAQRAAYFRCATLEFPLRDPLRIGGLFVHPLLDHAAMAAEGLAMDTCVGQLFHQCRWRSQRFFSVRDETGHRLSTFDLSFKIVVAADGVGTVDMALNDQCGRANREPTREAQEVVDAFVAYLKENAEGLRLRDFILMNSDFEPDELIEPYNPHDAEAESVSVKLHAVAVLVKEYLGELVTRL